MLYQVTAITNLTIPSKLENMSLELIWHAEPMHLQATLVIMHARNTVREVSGIINIHHCGSIPERLMEARDPKSV